MPTSSGVSGTEPGINRALSPAHRGGRIAGLLHSDSFPISASLAVLLTFFARLAVILVEKVYLYPPPLPNLPDDQQHWMFGYEMGRVARSIALGHGFSSPFHIWSGPTAWLPPLYPYLLAGIFKVFGVYSPASGLVALTLNCVAAAISCALIFIIAERIAGRTVALWSVWLWALLPSMMQFAVLWVWETEITIALFLLALWLTLNLPAKHGIRPWLLVGAVWGVIALINPSLLSMMPFMLAWAWWLSGGRARIAYAAAAMALMFAMTVPWIVRDRVVMGRWMFLRDNFWAELGFANDPTAAGRWLPWKHPGQLRIEELLFDRQGEINYIDGKKQQVLQLVRSNPEFVASLTLRHMVMFWTASFKPYIGTIDPPTILFYHSHVICLTALAWIGLLWMFLRGGDLRTYALLLAPAFLVYPCLYYVAAPYDRYRHIVEPLMLILAAFAIVTASRSRSLSGGQRPAQRATSAGDRV